MFWKELRTSIFACLRAAEGANVGLIRSSDGWVLVDTAFCPLDLLGALDDKGVVLADIHLAFNTHFHADHTWGNQLLRSPIVGHRLCRELMADMERGPWSRTAIDHWLAEVELTHPEQVRRCKRRLGDLRITPPSELFEDQCSMALDGGRLEFIHLGGHSPDLSVLWLPDEGVLFASDLIFEGRYPFIFDADLPGWIDALRFVEKLGAETIVPGHGSICGLAEVRRLREYLEHTRGLCGEHLSRGNEIDAVLADPNFPEHGPALAAELHQANIRHVYEQLVGQRECETARGAGA
jgi:cyclase